MIERIYDKSLIYSLMLLNWDELRPEHSFDEYQKAPVDGPVYYLVHTLDGVVTGMFMCVSGEDMDISVTFKPEFRGKTARSGS